MAQAAGGGGQSASSGVGSTGGSSGSNIGGLSLNLGGSGSSDNKALYIGGGVVATLLVLYVAFKK